MEQIATSTDKRRARGDETRQRILNSAILTIAAQGLSNLTLDRVAEHAGVSRTLVVFHFKSKKKLMQEGLDYLGKIYSDGWDAEVANTEGSTMERVLRLLDYDIRFAFENPEYVSAWSAFWGESRGNELYRKQAVPRDQQYAHDLEELLANFIGEENYDIAELPFIITGLNAMQFGFWVESHLDPKPDDYEKGLSAVRLFLGKIFPEHSIPPAKESR